MIVSYFRESGCVGETVRSLSFSWRHCKDTTGGAPSAIVREDKMHFRKFTLMQPALRQCVARQIIFSGLPRAGSRLLFTRVKHFRGIRAGARRFHLCKAVALWWLKPRDGTWNEVTVCCSSHDVYHYGSYADLSRWELRSVRKPLFWLLSRVLDFIALSFEAWNCRHGKCFICLMFLEYLLVWAPSTWWYQLYQYQFSDLQCIP